VLLFRLLLRLKNKNKVLKKIKKVSTTFLHLCKMPKNFLFLCCTKKMNMEQNIKSIVGNSIGTMNGNMLVGDTYNNYYQVEKIEKVENRIDVNGSNNIVLQGVTSENIRIEIQVSEELFYEQRKNILILCTDMKQLINSQQILFDIVEKIKAETNVISTLQNEIKNLISVLIEKLNLNKTKKIIQNADKIYNIKHIDTANFS